MIRASRFFYAWLRCSRGSLLRDYVESMFPRCVIGRSMSLLQLPRVVLGDGAHGSVGQRFLFLDMEDGNERKVSREMLDMADRGMSDEVLNCVMPYIHDPKDRDAVSLVCRRWYELDALTRKHITIALCYTTTPGRLRGRFPHLESLKLKGKPRAAMFNLIMEDWGGYVTPWVKEISDYFDCLKSLHFRRMIVKDSDLQLLAQARGRVLLVLKLDKCSGFSTDGLLHVGRSCR
ncbi:Coronatine-insensitive protein 1 [Vitis vinifera]|uniref:Coronatine-insensitive protein 1 n=1 Tax=Vitis vinifera TaxID=29760 RepID=A0A438FL81_VITVI|nr:Coronatine-insensitive protein 1 [Vitis vinifera]